jgi:hypothetical protein
VTETEREKSEERSRKNKEVEERGEEEEERKKRKRKKPDQQFHHHFKFQDKSRLFHHRCLSYCIFEEGKNSDQMFSSIDVYQIRCFFWEREGRRRSLWSWWRGCGREV